MDDFVISQLPYGYRAERLNSFFQYLQHQQWTFWSTPFVIDDQGIRFIAC